MGNRAVITTRERKVGIYLHWNGGRDTVEPLLKYCELQGYRPPSADEYGFARMCQVMGNFFGGSLSLGVGAYTTDRQMDPGDNGIYVIDGWHIADHLRTEYDSEWNPIGIRSFEPSEEENWHEFDDMLRSFDAAMPEELRLGEFLDSVEVSASDLQVGDEVWMFDGIHGKWEACPVTGFGEGIANGEDRDIWSAFVAMAATPMAMASGCAPGSLVKDAKRHFERYSGLTGELDEMLSALIDALEANSDRDVMGYVYNALGLPINARSQFFTPYNISKTIAQMMLADSVEAVKEKGSVTICDPCAGSGGMLVAAFNVLREQGMNPQADAWFEAQDISQDTTLMCYVQMSLLGMAGRVIVGDSLTGEHCMELLTIGAVAHPVWAARHLLA